MPAASTAFGQLRYKPETIANVTPTTGNPIELRVTEPTFKADIKSVSSNEINKYRMTRSSTNVDMDVNGGFNFELSAREFDPFLSGVVYGSWQHFGTAGLGASFTMTTIANKITAAAATTGSSIFTALVPGQWFKVNAPVGATQAVKDYFARNWFQVSKSVAPTATDLTLEAGTPIAAPGLLTAQAGYSITASLVSNGSTVSTFSFEWDQSDIGQRLVYAGMQPDMLDLDFTTGAEIKGSLGFMGRSHNISDTLMTGTPVASQTGEMMNSVTDFTLLREGGASMLSSGSFVNSLKLGIKNNLRGQKALGVFGNAGVGLGQFAVEGTLEVYFQDAAYYRKWLAGTVTDLTVGVADAAGNGYVLDMAKVKFKDGGLNTGDRDSDVMLSLPFEAQLGPGNWGLRLARAVAA